MENYRELFISEAEEYLQSITNSLLLLEKEPDNIEAVEEIFRSMHTLKGMAASMGYNAIVEISHTFEDLFGRIKNKEISINSDLVTRMFEVLDYLEALINDEEKSKNEIDSNIKNLIEGISSESNVNSSSEGENNKNSLNDSSDGVAIKIYINKDTPLKSVRSFIIIKSLEDNFTVLNIEPSRDDIMNENFGDSFVVFLKEEVSRESVEEVLYGMPDLDRIEILTGKSDKEDMEDKDKQDKEEKVKEKEEKGEEQGKESSGKTTDIDNKKVSHVSEERINLKSRTDIKVSLKRLDDFQNLVAELVIAKGALQRISSSIENENLHRIVSDMFTLIGALQDEVVNIRMVQVSDIFDRYPRYVRNIALKLGKKVDFQIKGREIELDRSILDKISDPLLHLLRNAIDHGIETPEERKKKGKSETGKLILEAKREKSNVIIEVFDDGRGLDPDKLIEIALRKGIISEEEAKNMSQREAIYLIARNGFSTKDTVTDISGRGVGVDAVKNVLSSVGGRLEIETKTGEWTKFKLIVPLTLAIIKAMYVKIGNQIMAIPLNYITETIDRITQNVYTVMGKEMIIIRNKLYPVYRLKDIYSIEGAKDKSGIIVQVADKEALITVEELLYQQDIVVKPLSVMLSDTPFYAGVTIMENGNPSLIIDVSSILV